MNIKPNYQVKINLIVPQMEENEWRGDEIHDEIYNLINDYLMKKLDIEVKKIEVNYI